MSYSPEFSCHIYSNYGRVTVSNFNSGSKIPSESEDVIARVNGFPCDINMSPYEFEVPSYVQNGDNIYEGRIIDLNSNTVTMVVNDEKILKEVTTKYDTIIKPYESKFSNVYLSCSYEDNIELSYTTDKLSWNPILYIDVEANSNYGEKFMGKVTLMGKIKIKDWKDFLVHLTEDEDNDRGLDMDITLIQTTSNNHYQPRPMGLVKMSRDTSPEVKEDIQNEILYPIGVKNVKGCCIQTILQSKEITADIYHVIDLSSRNASRKLIFKSPFYVERSRQILRLTNNSKSYEILSDGSSYQVNEKVVINLGMSDRIYSTISRRDTDKHSDIDLTINNRQLKSKSTVTIIVTIPRYLSPSNINPKPNWDMGGEIIAWKVIMKGTDSTYKMTISYDF